MASEQPPTAGESCGAAQPGPAGAARATILAELRRAGARSIDELAVVLDLSKTATRAHVLQLERAGQIARVPSHGDGPGRPAVRFALTELGGATFPSEDAELLARLLGFLDREGHEPLIRAFFAEVWAERRAAFEAELAAALPADLGRERGLAVRLRVLQGLLERDGFMPEVERRRGRTGTTVTIRECNCPLPAAVRATRIPCRLEVEFLAEAVGGRPTKVELAADRTQTCRFELAVPG